MAAVRKAIQTLDRKVPFFHTPDSGCLKDTRMLSPSIQPSRARRGWANAASCLPGEGHGDLVWWGGVGLGLGEGCRKSRGALVRGRSRAVPGLEAARAGGDGKGSVGEAR